jgi:predicted ester cyclase
MTADDSDAHREVARTALEQVCSRGDMTLAPKCYAEDFADHVGTLEYHGLGGVEQSTAVYRALFDDLAFNVVDQVAEGDRVASRFLVTGSNRGRTLKLWGITISRLRDGRIVEDYSAFDSLELLKRLGVWRTLLAAPRMHRALRQGRRR